MTRPRLRSPMPHRWLHFTALLKYRPGGWCVDPNFLPGAMRIGLVSADPGEVTREQGWQLFLSLSYRFVFTKQMAGMSAKMTNRCRA